MQPGITRVKRELENCQIVPGGEGEKRIMTKNILSIYLLFVLSLLISGCDDNSSGGRGMALSENDFAADASITVDPEKDHFVTFLEHPESDAPERDTGEVGTDIVTLEFKRAVTFSPCWVDENEEAAHTMVLLDSEGVELLRVGANGECPSETLAPGVYQAVFTHDGQTPEAQPIFARRPLDDEVVRETGF